MREVCFDTETTGLDPKTGDRIVEVGCVELVNYLPTGREFQIYVNPGRPVSEATVRVTGITNEMLRGKPRFEHPDVVDALMAFFGEDPIVAHNAEFDRGFLNHELELIGRAPLPRERFIDTVHLARLHRPGAPASLDAVCKRFNIALEGRELHGALKDARLLAEAYLGLRGGRERAFDFSQAGDFAQAGRGPKGSASASVEPRRPRRAPLAPRVSQAEQDAHAALIAELGEGAIWKRFG
jgi:DNA polymerase-3 subunit epsilon